MFVWSTRDMLGIDSNVAQHHLNISSKVRLMKQKPHKFALECQQVISDEVDKLLGEGFITEVKYPQWLTNVILVKKSNRN